MDNNEEPKLPPPELDDLTEYAGASVEGEVLLNSKDPRAIELIKKSLNGPFHRGGLLCPPECLDIRGGTKQASSRLIEFLEAAQSSTGTTS
jgi:hypothetical protein